MKQWLCDRWCVFLAAAYLLVVVIPFLDYYGLWFDEIFSVVMSRSIDSVVNMVSTQENNMLLHYFYLYLWQQLGGSGEFYLRASSVLLVLLSLFPLRAAVKRLANATTANVTVLFYVSHLLVLEHTRTCRGYSLALLMSSIVFWLWTAACASGRRRDWLLVGAAAGLAVWTHYFAALLPPVLLFAMVWRDGIKQPWLNICAAFFVFVLFALPIFLTCPSDGMAQIGWANVPTAQSIRSTLWMLSGSGGLYQEWLIKIMLASVVVAGLFKWRHTGLQVRNIFIGLASGFFLIVATVLLESFIGQPLFVYRFFTPLVPIYCAVVAVALCNVWYVWRAVVIFLILVTACYDSWLVYARGSMPARFWWRPLAQQLMWQLQSDDIILVYPSFQHLPVDYYLDEVDSSHHLQRSLSYSSAPYRAGGGVEPEPDWLRLQAAAHKAQRVWLIAEDGMQTAADIRLRRTHLPGIQKTLLDTNKVLAYDWHYDDRLLQRYDAVPDQTPSSTTNTQR